METPADSIAEPTLPAEEIPAAVETGAPTPAPGSSPAAQPFDFRHPAFLSSGHWRRLRMELDEFVESLAALLSTYLRLDFGLKVARVQTLSFNEFTAGLPVPTQMVLFKTDPLRGISVVEVRPVIGLGIVDRLLGGPGQAVALERNLSEMETALLDQFVEILLGEWTKHWKPVLDMKAQILGHENNARFLQSSSGGTMMLLVCLEARMGETVGPIQLAIPYTTIEPLVEKLGREMHASPSPAPAATPPVHWNKALDDLRLNLKARWPMTKVPTRTILELKVGDLIELDPEAADRIELCIGKTVKFQGRLGLEAERRAIQITQISKV